MAHVRNRSFKNQQLVAMRLFKEFNNTPYFFWGVMSIVMQAKESPDMGLKMFYPLAAKMVENHVSKHGYKAGAEIELHAMVYEGMGKFSEAEKLLADEETRELLSMPPAFLTARRLSLLFSAEDFRTVMERTIDGLKIDPDNWTLWTMLFDSSFELLKRSTAEGEQSGILSALLDIINADGFSTSRLRGPHLARLDLIGRFLREDEPIRILLAKMNLGNAIDLIINYVLRFYAKPCCYNDIAQYLWMLDDANKAGLANSLKEFIDSVIHQREQAGEDRDANCWAVIMNERLRRTIGTMDRMPRKERRKHVQLIIQGILQPSREQLAGTALAQLAAAILWSEWKVYDDWQSFYEMILLLEWASNEYPTDPFCKLILCRAYAYIGCMYRMVALARSLDIKSVQRDTLGYIMFNVGIIHYTEMVEGYEQADKEISEALIGAYRNGAFMQVDFTRLRHYLSQAVGSAGGAKGGGSEELGADLTLLRVHLNYCRDTYRPDYANVRVCIESFYAVSKFSLLISLGTWKILGSDYLVTMKKMDVDTSCSVLPEIDRFMEELSGEGDAIYDDIITCSRVLQSLATCQLLIRTLEKRGGIRHLDGAQRKSKSAGLTKSEFVTHCEALQNCVRSCASQLKSFLSEMDHILKDNGFNLVPKIGTDWSEERYTSLHGYLTRGRESLDPLRVNLSSIGTVPLRAKMIELQSSAVNTIEDGELLESGVHSCREGNQHCADMIFEGDYPEERGDHVVGPDFECGGVEVIWLANSVLDDNEVEKESRLFYPTVEVGANETATFVPSNPSGPLDPGAAHQEPAHAASSNINVFQDSTAKLQESGRTWPLGSQEQSVHLSSAAAFGIDQLTQEKNERTVYNFSSNADLSGNRSSTVCEAKAISALRPAPAMNLAEYMLQANGIQIPAQSSQANGITTTHPAPVFHARNSECGYSNTPISYLSYPIIHAGCGMVPNYMNHGFPGNPQFGTSGQTLDLNSNILQYQIGQQQRADNSIPDLNANVIGGPVSALQQSRATVPVRTHQGFSLQQTLMDTPLLQVDPLHSYSVEQRTNSSVPAVHQQYRNAAVPTKTIASLANAGLSSGRIFQTEGGIENIASLGFQVPFVQAHSSAVDVGSSGNRNVELIDRRDCCPPVLTPSIGAASAQIPRKERSRIRHYCSVTKYPNMADVNIRRRPGSKVPSRPRHLCDQTREIIGRVCAYFREFSKRYAALGNTIANTPFEHPDRMASHATGFALQTIRKCAERVEVMPYCTYRPGSHPTEQQLEDLSQAFSEEPLYASLKDRGRCHPTRKKTRKRVSPSPSLQEIEDFGSDADLLHGIDIEQGKSDGVPKRRRSLRIMNQRRAKMLNRLRVKKCDNNAAMQNGLISPVK
ncbi:unnamed protein product [Nippostrongylus brasiliensis]|uniref:TPR_REGION domain-containing protein n=1 Tax=Nippostrongylus brasiliensis TaxID=27835 RepID=A0A0N4YDK0_NIPBR|nr:unnamed protein product [Nippostrongylus brasiliensis]